MKKLMFMVLIICFAGSSGAFAQGLYFGPQLGFFKSKDSDNTNIFVGAAVRLKSAGSFGVEGSIGYRQEKFFDETVTVKNWPIMVPGLFYPIPIVYGAMGAGWYNTTIEYDDNVPGVDLEDNSETSQEFGWHFGFGAELPVGGKTKLSTDIRYVFLNYDFNAVPGSGDVNSNFYIINAGLMFRL